MTLRKMTFFFRTCNFEIKLQSQIQQLNAELQNNFTGGTGGPGGPGGVGGPGGNGGQGGQGGNGIGGQGGLGGQGGQGGEGGDATADINTLVQLLEPWTDIITAVRDRLPLQALAY